MVSLERVRELLPPDTIGNPPEVAQLREAVAVLAVLALPESSEADKQTALTKLREMFAMNMQISLIQAEGEEYKKAQGLIE